jgi:hypothetical protein
LSILQGKDILIAQNVQLLSRVYGVERLLSYIHTLILDT